MPDSSPDAPTGGDTPRRSGQLPRPSTPGAGGSLTGRALIVFTVLALLVVALSVPVRNWLSQRAQVAALRADISASTERINELQTELDSWSDPAYISSEARRRLHFLLPGEIGYVTISRDGRPAEAVLSEAATEKPLGWHSLVWDSLERSDGPPIAAKDDDSSGT